MAFGKAGKIAARLTRAKARIDPLAPKFDARPVGCDGPATGQVIEAEKHVRRKITRRDVADGRMVKQSGTKPALSGIDIATKVAQSDGP